MRFWEIIKEHKKKMKTNERVSKAFRFVFRKKPGRKKKNEN